jgi:hypothetical protein
MTETKQAEVEACFYCTAIEEPESCHVKYIDEVSVQYAYLRTREEVEQLLLANGYRPEQLTESRCSMHLSVPNYRTITRMACSRHTLLCHRCREPYVQMDATLDCDAGIDWYRRVNDWPYSGALCRDCSTRAVVCGRCDEITDRYDGNAVSVDGTWWCLDCAEGYAEHCEYCDSFFPTGYHRCMYAPTHTPSGAHVRSYTYKPTPDFKWVEEIDGDLSVERTRRKVPFMGLELEVELEGNMQTVEALAVCEESFGDIAYYKHDGSLDNGFEIVTHPMTLAAFKTLIDWDFCRALRQGGVRSWDTRTCGLHVHISRSSFRSLTHVALFQFLVLHNEKQFTVLAGRDPAEWAHFDGVSGSVIKEMKGRANRDRYEAVNVTNSATLEVRIFKGSLKKERVLMALELVNACWEYTKDMGSNAYINGACNWSAFAAWASGKEEYEELNHYITALPQALQE